jgi:hypothetical protein
MIVTVNNGWVNVLTKQLGWRILKIRQFGPAGIWLTVRTPDGRQGTVIVTESNIPGDEDQIEWIHASISFPDADPTYQDLADLHRAVFGRKRWAYQLFTPESSHYNFHEHALHLWGRTDGKPMMPDFAAVLGRI